MLHSSGEVGPLEAERPFLYSSMSMMEASRAAWSSCSCSSNTSRRKEHGRPGAGDTAKMGKFRGERGVLVLV